MNFEILLLIIIVSVLLLIILILFIISEVICSKIYNSRCDNRKDIKIFNYNDFDFLDHKDFEFNSSDSLIKGRIYSLKDKEKLNNKIIIFFHGFGGGHENYMHEIIEFVNKGYLVFAYDNLGCELSEGKSIKGLLEVFNETENFYKYFKTLKEYQNKDIYLVGHSWGGFNAINSSNIIKDAKKVVALSSFNSANYPSKGNLLIIKLCRVFFYIINLFKFKKYINFVSKKTIKRNKNIEYLLINGENDKVVFPSQSSNIYSKLNYPNLNNIVLKNKGHSLQLEVNSEKYLIKFLNDMKKEDFNGNSYDYELLTKQDKNVYDIIFKFLEN